MKQSRISQFAAIITEDSSHIPRGEPGSAQNRFKMLYNHHGQQDLSASPNCPREESLRRAIADTKEYHPGFIPELDEAFFRP